jgi:hypothetical protein
MGGNSHHILYDVKFKREREVICDWVACQQIASELFIAGERQAEPLTLIACHHTIYGFYYHTQQSQSQHRPPQSRVANDACMLVM